MAIIDDTYNPGISWPTFLTEYQISFTEEEEKVLEKYNDPELAKAHNAYRGGVDNGDVPIRNFEILWISHNIVARHSSVDQRCDYDRTVIHSLHLLLHL